MEGLEQGTNMTHNQVCALEMNNNNNCLYSAPIVWQERLH